MKVRIFVSIAVLSIFAVCHAEVKLPSIFSDNMVLQQGRKLPVWGTAAAGEKIKVSFNDQEADATADESGKWMVELAPMNAGGPFEMKVSGGNTVTIANILVGEVWLCSGQSNMAWSFQRDIQDREKHLAAANHPKIRLFQVPRKWSSTPLNDTGASWQECTRETVESFSAVGYFFGLELYDELKVPVGLINASWGGTRIEPWTPWLGFKDIPALKDIWTRAGCSTPGTALHRQKADIMYEEYRNWLADTRKRMDAGEAPVPPPKYPPELIPFSGLGEPTTLYNAMLHPLAPFAIRGAIWYQGEANIREGMLYYEKMKALLNGWREVWKNPDLAFYFVQLAPYSGYASEFFLPHIWQAQEKFAADTPGTGMAVINDIGNLKNIHPANKLDVGKRLALQALHKTYGQKEITADSPTLKSMETDGNKVLLTFNAKSLKTRDGKHPDWFEICGPDSVFVKADALITNNTVTVSAQGVEQPLVVRYAWSGLAEPNLTGETGLPVGAFMAGNYPDPDSVLESLREKEKYRIVYSFDPVNSQTLNGGRDMKYDIDDSDRFTGKTIRRIAYFMALDLAGGGSEYVFVSMKPFTQDVKKIGVPTFNTKARFQQRISDLQVISNVPALLNGTFDEGNIEFWPHNYSQLNSARVPGATDTAFDSGDRPNVPELGYGSMQIHNFGKKQTVFAFNNFKAGRDADAGIGNCPGPNPDWTFAKSALNHKSGKLAVLVQIDE